MNAASENAAIAKGSLWLRVLLLSALTALMSSVISHLILRNFYRFLEFDQQFYLIFKQISSSDTQISTPLVPSFFILFILFFALTLLWQKGKAWRVLAVFSGTFFVLVLFVASILLTRVNGIMFLDVVLSLVPLLVSGAL